MKPAPNAPCPCGSKQKYKKCCQRYHKGATPPDALSLMKSRYTAFAYEQSDYIIKTTHPNNSDYTTDKKRWREDILAFSRGTTFRGLKIISFETKGSEAFVTFEANLSSGLLKEKSRFLQEEGRWLYVDGEFTL